jgi:lysophospholipase L1-like esterase
VGPNDVIVAFGDSLTHGTGANEAESYPAVLASLINRKVVRAGVPGETTADGLRRIESVLEEHRPALVVMSLGGNDMLRKVSDSEITLNLRRIIQLIRGRGASVVLFGVPRPGLITSAPEFYEEIAREFNIPYEGKIVTDVLYHPDQKSDMIHPNAKGYRRMAEAFAELLKKAGAI